MSNERERAHDVAEVTKKPRFVDKPAQIRTIPQEAQGWHHSFELSLEDSYSKSKALSHSVKKKYVEEGDVAGGPNPVSTGVGESPIEGGRQWKKLARRTLPENPKEEIPSNV
jgi:cytochrome c peroxidase